MSGGWLAGQVGDGDAIVTDIRVTLLADGRARHDDTRRRTMTTPQVGGAARVTLLTDDRACAREARAAGLRAATVREFVAKVGGDGAGGTPPLHDLVAMTSSVGGTSDDDDSADDNDAAAADGERSAKKRARGGGDGAAHGAARGNARRGERRELYEAHLPLTEAA